MYFQLFFFSGESFLSGHEDTAPSEDAFDVLPTNPPMPPIRIDSNNSHRQFTGLVNQNRNVPPPPYNAQHKITSIPAKAIEKHEEVAAAPLRDPPPYDRFHSVPFHSNSQEINLKVKSKIDMEAAPQQSKRIMMNKVSNSPTNHVPTSNILPEEAAARFITTRPQINILKAHTSLVGENQLKPSYAAPTINSVAQIQPCATQSLLASTIGN